MHENLKGLAAFINNNGPRGGVFAALCALVLWHGAEVKDLLGVLPGGSLLALLMLGSVLGATVAVTAVIQIGWRHIATPNKKNVLTNLSTTAKDLLCIMLQTRLQPRIHTNSLARDELAKKGIILLGNYYDMASREITVSDDFRNLLLSQGLQLLYAGGPKPSSPAEIYKAERIEKG